MAKPTLVLVHGAWHGPWCWEHLLPELEALGYAVATVALPCTAGKAGVTQFDDAAAVRAAVEARLARGEDVVVVAHSYGGPVGSGGIVGLSGKERAAAGRSGGVLGLVVLTGYIFPSGMDQGQVIRDMGGLPYVRWDEPAAGLFLPTDPRAMFFPPDVPEPLVDWAVEKLRPQSSAANTGLVPPQAWQDPSFAGRFAYIRCTADTILPVAQQDQMVAAAGGPDKWLVRSLEGSGHSPFLSRPKELAATVDDIVAEFDKA